MLICPQLQCKSENPGNHKFCQVCGTSLTHYICTQCDGEVDFDAEACPQCQTPSGTYLLGIVSLAGKIELTAADDEDDDDDVPITEIRFIDDDGEELGLLTDPWHMDEAEDAGDMRPSGDLGRSSGDLTAEAALAVLEPPQVAVVASAAPEPVAPAAAIVQYLDADRRYRSIEPTEINLDRRRRVAQVRVLDRRPYAQTALECLMADEPITMGSTSIDRQPETYRQWNFWNEHGIPRIAQAYIALRSLLSTSIPNIKDAWESDDKIFTLVEDRSNWLPLTTAWAKPETSPTEIICWLDYTLKLWVALEPWQMRQSLLDLDNLVIDEDDIICLRSLQTESPVAELTIADLGRMWRDLFGRASIIPNPELILTIAAMANGELLRIEDIRSALQQQARDWGGEVTADISATTADLTSEVTSSAPVSRPLTRELLGVEDGASTHVGRKREHNEDFFGVITKLDRRHAMNGRSVAARGLYILCDGMGGHDGGEVASRMTVESLRQYFVDNWKETIPDEEMIRNAIISANQEVYDLNQSNSSSGNGRMGTTLVMVLLQDRTIAVAHVGDSRCYAITSSQGLIQLTLDHEVGQQEILRGVDPEIAYGRPNSYQLTQAIGPRDRNFVSPDISFFELQEDTLVVLASDGLTDNQLLETNWLTNLAPLMSSHADMQQGVDRLVDFANEYNGHDNITAIGVRVRIG